MVKICVKPIIFLFVFQTHSTQREHEILKKKTDGEENKTTKKSKIHLEAEKRDEGLQKSLGRVSCTYSQQNIT